MAKPTSTGWLPHVRLAAGLTLFAYVTTHLVNISLGLISLDALEQGRALAVSVWRNPVLWMVVPLALLVHVTLALYSMLNRRTFKKLTGWELLQAGLAHLIPVFLLGHLVQTRTMSSLHGVRDTYSYVLSGGPFGLWFLLGLLIVAWSHGNIGLHAWLRLHRWYRKAFWLLASVSVALPLAAVAGIVKAQLEVNALARDPSWLRRIAQDQPMPRADYDREVLTLYFWVLGIVLGGVALAYVARALIGLTWRRAGLAIQYSNGKTVEVDAGTSVLEASRIGGIAHSSVCGGRGRCSTCRVRVYLGREALPKPTSSELRLLKRIAAPDNVRIACQLYPVAPVAVSPILDPEWAGPAEGFPGASSYEGRELEAAILFADLRGFTSVAEHKLAFDVVHILNQYIDLMGEAITSQRGTIDKFMGDGIMAFFEGGQQGARNALAASHEMLKRLEVLNHVLGSELDEPLRMGIGIHVGVVVLGPMGYGKKRSLTAIGDPVNTASRVESLCKDFDCSIVVSEKVLKRAGLPLEDLPRHNVEIRGRTEPLSVVAVPDSTRLAASG